MIAVPRIIPALPSRHFLFLLLGISVVINLDDEAEMESVPIKVISDDSGLTPKILTLKTVYIQGTTSREINGRLPRITAPGNYSKTYGI